MKHGSWVIMAALLLSATVWAFSDSGKCTANPGECVAKLHTKLSQAGWMGIEKEKTEDGQVAIAKVYAGSPAEKSGLLAGDIIVAINGIDLKSTKSEKEKKIKFEPGATMTFTIQRGKKTKDYAVVLTKMPDEKIAQVIGEHMIKEHMPGIQVTQK